MAMSWRNFFYGAVDPLGTVTVDKLPGALWIQALSIRLFGFHYWAVALPQVVEGVLTVLVLFRIVRRLVGPRAGLLAALVLAATPITALLNRGNVSDSLLLLTDPYLSHTAFGIYTCASAVQGPSGRAAPAGGTG
jgi:4-amino-4-deoxy-L-arabinose transferase-like glycosyltransferase